MASYAAIHGVLTAIESLLQERFPTALAAGPVNAQVQVFGSQDFKRANVGNVLALYLYRVSIDPSIPGGFVRRIPGRAAPRVPEIPLMLHILMIAMADTAFAEISLAGWGLAQLAATPLLGIDRLSDPDLAWDDTDQVQIATEDVSREELARIWDTLPAKYSLTVPYVARGVRVALQPEPGVFAPVTDRTFVAAHA